MRLWALATLSGLAVAGAAHADVKAKADDRMELHYETEVMEAKAAVWARMLKPGSWWGSDHTYSGKASNMKLQERAGGCWCETWDGNQIEHGRVVALMPGSVIRFETALGPLQEMGVAGSLTWTVSQGSTPNSTKLVWDYKVSGGAGAKLDAIAPVVDQVMADQFKRLAGGGG